MSTTVLHSVLLEGFLLLLLLLAPPLLAVYLAGALSGFLASLMQVHDPVSTFVPKVVAAAAALIAFGPWIWERFISFTRVLWLNLHL